MPDVTLRRHDLAVGLRGDRIAIGRAGTGAPPIFLGADEARWLATVALPALDIAPPLPDPPACRPDNGRHHEPTTEEPPADLAAPARPAAALF